MKVVYDHLVKGVSNNVKLFAVLIDTDSISKKDLLPLLELIVKAGVDLVFVGGSLLMKNDFNSQVRIISENVNIPVLLFPGNVMQISEFADAILFLSLISGRNPEYLIGQQVIAAPQIRLAGLESIPTGYILVDGGKPTSVSYMSNTTPVPSDKIDICVSTAIAGEMLGQKLIYLDGGSGAKRHVPELMIRKVKQNISVPLIVGGGLSTPEKVERVALAGADIVVVGNAIEKNQSLLEEMVFASKIKINEDHSNI